jgi:putative transposase
MSAAEDEDAVGRERARAVGMFRYGLIREAADPGLSSKERGRRVRALAQQEHTDPWGQKVRYSRDHLDRWIRTWRRGGFDALVPPGRAPHARIDPAVLELAFALKRERPARTAAQVARILRRQSGWSPSETTLLRHFHRAGLQLSPGAGAVDTSTVFGRFEAERPNELWTGDALHGPTIGGRKMYLFAFIDDHTRLIVGHRWGLAEDTVRLAAALHPALASRGVPESVYVDNGSAFVDAWLLRACAKLGIRLTHSTPGRPQGRGKIERFFRTVNEQFLVEIAPGTGERSDASASGRLLSGDDPIAGLLELNRLFGAWVEQVYHRTWHSETGQTPLGRWNAGWADAPPLTPTATALSEAFFWEERRTVRKNATVSLHSNDYQVEDSLIGRKVELVFDPFDLTRIQVRYQGRPMGVAVPYRITRHAHPKARPETDLSGFTPPEATGINYLDLIATAHQQSLAEITNYAALSAGPGPDPSSDPVDPVDAALDAELASFAAYRQHLAATAPDTDGDGDGDGVIAGQLDLTDLLTTPTTSDDDEDQTRQEESPA